jgi:adenylate cyclase
LPADAQEIEEEWRKTLTEGHRPLRIMRAVFHRLPNEPRCKVCHNPFGGIGGKVVSLFGYRPSRKNPNLCRQCCEVLPAGGAEIDLAILFADVRGSTTLAEKMSPAEYAALMNRFYVSATRVLVQREAVIDKLIGDEVMALFVPGFCGPRYRALAAEAAISLLEAVGYRSGAPWLHIGVGVHHGTAYVGNVGSEDIVDFTALGDAVNTAARLQGVAQSGEVAMTDGVYEAVRERFPDAEERVATLRGKGEPLTLRIIRA